MYRKYFNKGLEDIKRQVREEVELSKNSPLYKYMHETILRK